MNIADEIQDLREAPCPRCGAQAEVSFAAQHPAQVEVACPICGLFDMTREEFDKAASEMAEPDDRGSAD
jgi:ribosomal protein S27AE